jgi:hypothetical protein
MDLVSLTEQVREMLAELTISPATQAIPKLKKKVAGQYGYDPARSEKGTRADRTPKSGGGGDSTAAGVKHKDVKEPTRNHQKTVAKAPTSGKGEKPTCPGGKAPRMVFGKWRCAGQTSKGAKQAKSRIAAKRQQKGSKKAAPKSALGKLVHKARSALLSLFK